MEQQPARASRARSVEIDCGHVSICPLTISTVLNTMVTITIRICSILIHQWLALKALAVLHLIATGQGQQERRTLTNWSQEMTQCAGTYHLRVVSPWRSDNLMCAAHVTALNFPRPLLTTGLLIPHRGKCRAGPCSAG